MAPTVKQTIPRLELLGTLMLSKLVRSVATPYLLLAVHTSGHIQRLLCTGFATRALFATGRHENRWVKEIRELIDSNCWNFALES